MELKGGRSRPSSVELSDIKLWCVLRKFLSQSHHTLLCRAQTSISHRLVPSDWKTQPSGLQFWLIWRPPPFPPPYVCGPGSRRVRLPFLPVYKKYGAIAAGWRKTEKRWKLSEPHGQSCQKVWRPHSPRVNVGTDWDLKLYFVAAGVGELKGSRWRRSVDVRGCGSRRLPSNRRFTREILNNIRWSLEANRLSDLWHTSSWDVFSVEAPQIRVPAESAICQNVKVKPTRPSHVVFAFPSRDVLRLRDENRPRRATSGRLLASENHELRYKRGRLECGDFCLERRPCWIDMATFKKSQEKMDKGSCRRWYGPPTSACTEKTFSHIHTC